MNRDTVPLASPFASATTAILLSRFWTTYSVRPCSRRPSPFVTTAPPRSIALLTPVAATTRYSFPFALWTTERLPVGRRVDAVQVEAADELEVAGEREGGRRGGGRAVLREREAIEDSAVRVGEVRRALRHDDVVDERRAAARRQLDLAPGRAHRSRAL